MTEFTVGDVDYRVGALSAIKQIHIVRRIAPLLGELVTPELVAKLDRAREAKKLDPLEFFPDVAKAFGKMNDADVEYIIETATGACERKQDDQWFALRRNGALMYQDIGPAELLEITINVVMDKLENFIPALRAPSTSASILKAAE